MNYSKTVPFFLILLLFIRCSNDNTSKNLLLAPDNWRGEIIEFPLKFASSLTYSGTEHVRFAPGWGEKDATDYFSYVFLWEIDENPQLSIKKLETEIETYFDGLMSMVSKMNLNLFKKLPKAKAFFEKVNDSVYVGKVMTYDAFTTKKEVNLNIIVDYKFCDELNKHLVLFNLSPQHPKHSIWKKMQKVTIDANCEQINN
ncbi:hypothetical protein [Aquimarina celericrescens]|uniref:Lipoprotein n=1 Tax=Aquimarina celericrescens TaxID=1964542 RepID=A0ABW5AQP4_9FLAO|nr:hypothetical protein [Aquimarina celericrescens]